jgi:hypothetical protein
MNIKKLSDFEREENQRRIRKQGLETMVLI